MSWRPHACPGRPGTRPHWTDATRERVRVYLICATVAVAEAEPEPQSASCALCCVARVCAACVGCGSILWQMAWYPGRPGHQASHFFCCFCFARCVARSSFIPDMYCMMYPLLRVRFPRDF